VTRWLATYAAVQALGVLVLPLVWAVCRRLPDRGVSVAKHLGLLLTGLLLWVGTSHGLLRNDLGGSLLAAALVAAVSAAVGRDGLRRDDRGRRPLPEWLLANRTMLVAQEVVFAAVFLGWTVVRAHDPAVDHTEQPMDFMLLTASSVSPTLPLPDPWLSGHAVGYYYLGHFFMSLLGRLAHQPPEIAYTLGQAAWLALLAAGCHGLAANLFRLARPLSRARGAVAAGLLGAATVALAGNLQGTLDAAQHAGIRFGALASGRVERNLGPPSDHWWWWRSARVLGDLAPDGAHLEVIDEVPAFSYVLGDNHPHVLAQPFVILALALALNRYLAGGRPRRAETALLVAVVAAIAFVNTADLPAVAVLILGAVAAGARRERPVLTAIHATAVLGAGVVLLLAPFLVTAQSQVRGLLANALHPTPVAQLALMFGTLVPGLLLLLDPATRAHGRVRLVLVAAGAIVPLVVAAGIVSAAGVDRDLALARWARDPWTVVAVGGLLGALAARLASGRGDAPTRAVWAGTTVAVALVLVPELVYLADDFGTRMNTVFKLYYQAWLLLGLGAAFATAVAWDHPRRVRRWAARASAAAATIGILFTGVAAWDVTGGFRRSPSLDALGHVPVAERAAIDWVRAHLPPGVAVLQGVGRSYAADESRLSAATGRPTLLGWDAHELQWRGRAFGAMTAGRGEAVQAVYEARDAAELRAALDAWRIRYVYVGAPERRRYAMAASEQVLGEALDVAFQQDDVRIYRRRVME
jgi:YYY domain-containing protein